jgi:hypothetical protein
MQYDNERANERFLHSKNGDFTSTTSFLVSADPTDN